ncbi:helix-turn-helix domain-containing protein [Crateriforma conspicua]|uniref:helix-turn-helix domain-containing protein n=1 Tax=Crateriforma conspicua TaxID=2527996 RepID=UPI00118AD5B1|nr:helix-turn-helix domain-containing protein [Crateriforma conspicua]QDV61993.1 Helix-turn-helix domain protein [Crateriforma conspicua]
MLLTPKEVAARLRISLSKAYALISRGDLPCYQIGSCKRVSESDLNMFLEQNRKQLPKLPTGGLRKRHF